MRRAGTTFRTLFALVAICALPASASAAPPSPPTVVAKTDKGGSCLLETIAIRAGNALTYGGRVNDCSARYGFRSVQGRGLLYENLNALLVAVTPRGSPGLVPYENSATFTGKAGVPYRARFDVTVVLRSRRSASRPKKPEHWIDPGKDCHVGTSKHAGDMLSCTLAQDF